MRAIRSICVYCGSGQGTDPVFTAAARVLGRMMAKAGIRLVYGGGRIGLMGEVARSVLDAGGTVTGIIPKFLKAREVMLADAQELHVVEDMHARKKLMFDKADAFIALPGESGFVRPGLEVKYLVAERIEDALEMLLAAARMEAPQDEEARDIIRHM